MSLQITFTALATLIALILVSIRRKCSKLTPGPPSYPLIGNLLSIPGNYKYKKLREIAGLYGDVTFFHGLGQKILIINNLRAMNDILIKRSDVSSGRPVLMMAGELVGYTNSLPFKQPGPEFREMGKRINHTVGKAAAAKRNSLFDNRFVARYLQKLHTHPDKLFEHNRWLLGAFTLGVAYGYKPKDHGDALVEDAGRAIAELAELVEPGRWIVDLFPFLKHILMRVPSFKCRVTQYQDSQKALSIVPYRMVKQQLRDGTAPPSFCANLIQDLGDQDIHPDQEAFIAWTVGNIYAGGSDTTVSSLTTFSLAMCYAPQVQRKAQAEIDLFSKINYRWPNLQERDQFPYLQALIKEIYRWGVVLPLGFPHRLTEDLPYDGYLIPRDTTLLPNLWAICHDEAIYPKPYKFEPERFLGSDPQLDPREFVFGGGKRICPGIDMTDKVLFMTLAAALAVSNIKPRPDYPPSYTYQDKMARQPTPFVCEFEYRSPKAESWVMWAMDDRDSI